MSINEVKPIPISLSQVVFKQYLYKLKGHSGLIYTLILIQIVSALFSMGMRGSMSSGSDAIRLIINIYSGDFLFVFSGMWMMIVTGMLGSQPYRSMEFSVVNNRVASQLSNIILVLTFACFAGITSTLMTGLHRLVIALTLKENELLYRGLDIIPQDLLLGTVVGTLYLILLAAGVYLIQNLSLLSKGLRVIFWIFIFAVGFINILLIGFPVGGIVSFYTTETSLVTFALKVVSTVVLCFGLSVLISKRVEVKR